MIFNEIKCHTNTPLGLVGGCIPCIPPCVRACRKRLNSSNDLRVALRSYMSGCEWIIPEKQQQKNH